MDLERIVLRGTWVLDLKGDQLVSKPNFTINYSSDFRQHGKDLSLIFVNKGLLESMVFDFCDIAVNIAIFL